VSIYGIFWMIGDYNAIRLHPIVLAGDTPLPDGGLLITEIGGWITRLDANGALVWSIRSPVAYPSDAQLYIRRT
jgi:hypothetical protein